MNAPASEAHLTPPKQARSRRTLERLVDAALRIIADEGVDEVTVAKVVKRAGSSVGSFYARFSGKDELVQYLTDRVWHEARERWEEARERQDWSELSLKELVGAVVHFLIRSHREDRGRRLALGDRHVTGEDRALEFREFILADLVPLFLERSAEITHPDPERSAVFGFWVVAVAVERLLDREELHRELLSEESESPDEALARELSRVYLGYLGHGRGYSTEVVEEKAEFFDIWG